jgi:hypothetical protein
MLICERQTNNQSAPQKSCVFFEKSGFELNEELLKAVYKALSHHSEQRICSLFFLFRSILHIKGSIVESLTVASPSMT